MDLQNFIQKLIVRLQLSDSAEVKKFLTDWANHEKRPKGKPHGFNPFNTTFNLTIDKGMTNFNKNAGYPVKNYSTIDFGVEATAKTLLLPYYKDLLSMLKGIKTVNLEKDRNRAIARNLRTWGTINFANKIDPKTAKEGQNVTGSYILPIVALISIIVVVFFYNETV